MHRASTAANKALTSSVDVSLESIRAPLNGLTRSCYKNLLKEARYFDSQPLAKALLSASPFLRKDPCWSSLVQQKQQSSSQSQHLEIKQMKKVKTTATAAAAAAAAAAAKNPQSPTYELLPYGLVANTLAVPTVESNSLQSCVRREFRNTFLDSPAFDATRYFNCMRRLELAKKLHISCAETQRPFLPEVSPKLQSLPKLSTQRPPVIGSIPTCLSSGSAAATIPSTPSVVVVNKTDTGFQWYTDAPPASNKKLTKAQQKKLAKQSKKAAVVAPAPVATPGVGGGALKPGSMLLAHPVLVDDFTQATVLVTSVNPAEGVTGLTLNVPYVPLQMVMNTSSGPESTLRQRFPELWSKKIKASNQSFFSEWVVYSGGSLACAPLLVHQSADLASGIDKMNGAQKKPKQTTTSGFTEAYAVQLPGGWWVHALSDIMMLDTALVQNTVEENKNARIVMNYSGWSEEQLLEEVCQNWWIATEASSSCKALESLFHTVEVPTSTTTTTSSPVTKSQSTTTITATAAATAAPAAVELQFGAPSNYMWQRAVANLGGELSDYARLKVVELEEGDYRRMITETFQDDLPAATSASRSSSSSDADSEGADNKKF